ncbi:thioesterase domain-containing protein, partial [Sphingobacterium hotanense]|uniref:thioesterase domain-containing protein n=1 Tax=Sphingobacterium hotanense TaxID=649196 RepID=UPI0021A8981D
IQRIFQCRLSMGAFMQNPTIGVQAGIISATQGNVDPVLIVEMGEHKIGKPCLYLLPPLIGSPLIYQKMCNMLSRNYNCYGLQDPGFEESDKIDATLNDKINLFVKQIAQHNTDKKVRLFGFSYGATTAFEVAKELENKGFEIVLTIVDRPVTKRQSIFNLKQNPIEYDDINRFLDKIRTIDPSISYISDITYNWNNNIKLLEKYQQKGRIKGRLIAFKSKDNLSTDFLSMESWKGYTANSFQHYYLEGDHYECLEINDNIEKIYKILLENEEVTIN